MDRKDLICLIVNFLCTEADYARWSSFEPEIFALEGKFNISELANKIIEFSTKVPPYPKGK